MMEKEKRRFEIQKLEERIAPAGCAAFGSVVSSAAQTGNLGAGVSFVAQNAPPGTVADLVHLVQNAACQGNG
jgi:hypothetical protein